ncbi:MAG: hypothetical protein J6M20_09675 [Clostridia bacterium]|nr:hypothetical protein [Clostridia bacterium]
MKNMKWLSLVLALVLCLFALPAQAEVQTVTIAFTPQVELPDNDELFAMYAEGQLYGYGGISFFGTRAGDALSGVPKQIYSGLKPMIEAVAAGTQTSTVFTVELTAAYPGAADINAAAALFQADFSKATDALLADCPFELFWFDKISKTDISMTFSNNDPWTISKAVVSMPVAGDYANGEYTVNALPAKVATAASAAQTLVANNASKSDLEKLEAYKEYICDAVSYDKAAAGAGDDYFSATDIDPWQLISVFDGDGFTNVVCEGYSKAFQYLCDLSTFSNETLAVYTVSGTMAAPDESGVVGAGPHMWNIVSMDGKNYLVDVTNSEYETVGMGGELFMAKANKGGSVANGYVVAGYNDTPVTYKYDSDQKALWGESVLKLAENVPVASITSGTTVTEYMDFADALAAWTDGTTLTLLDDVSYDSGITLDAGTRTFDGGDYTLDLAGKGLLNEGTLTIQNAKITSNAAGVIVVDNRGMMVIKESTITNSKGTAIGNVASLTVENSVLNAMSACLSTDGDTAALTNCTLNCQEIEIEYAKGKLTIVGDCDGWEVRNTGDVLVAIGTDIELPAGYYMFELTEPGAPERLVTSLNRYGTIRAHEHEYTYTDNGDGTHNYGCTCGLATAARHDFAENAAGEWVCDCKAKAVAKVEAGGTATCYTVFADAVAAWTDGTTLTLLDDVTYNSSIYCRFDESYTFVGNGHTLDLGEQKITNGGTLTIKGGRITTASSQFYAICNQSGGTLIISDGAEIINTNNYAVTNYGGTLTATGCTLTGMDESFYIEGGSAELTNATIKGVTIYGGTLKLTNCTVKPNNYHIEFFGGELVIDGDCAGWAIGNINSAAAAIGTDKAIQLPADHYVFVGNTIVTELAGNRIGTIGKHTSADHNYEYTPNGDGLTHDMTCTAGCGAGETNVPHTAPDASGKCICGAQIVAQVGTAYYSDFAKAVAAWTDGTTLTLLDDVSYDSDIELGAGTRTFAGGEHTLTLTSEANWIDNEGTLTIASGTITSEGSCAIQNSGTLNITGGMVSATAEGGVAVMNNSGTLNITGGKVSAMAMNGFAITNNGDMTLDGGTIEGYSCIENSGTAELKRGTVTASDVYALNNAGTATLSGADLATEGNNPAVFCNSGKTTISGGTLDSNGTYVIQRVDGTLTITTTGCNGWKVISSAETATIGKDITLPDGYCLFNDHGKFIANLEAGVIGTITAHTHKTLPIDNKDGKSHDFGCACGAMSNQVIPHFVLNAEDKCVCGAQLVAKVGEAYYSDIAVAMDDWVNNGGTMTLLRDATYTSEYGVSLWSEKPYTFVGDGCTLELQAVFSNHAQLTIESGTIKTSEGIHNVGTLHVKGGTIESESSGISNENILTIENGVTVTAKTVCIADSQIRTGNVCQITINGGTFSSDDYVMTLSGGTVAINGGSMKSVNGKELLFENGDSWVTIKDGVIPDAGWKVSNNSNTPIVLSNCLSLPSDHYVFVGDEIIDTLEIAQAGVIKQHSHSYTATADDDTDTITYACSCGIGTQTAKLLASAEPLVYNGMAYISTVKLTGSTVAPAVVYTQNGQGVAEMKNAGDYTVTINWHGKEVSMSITILPADIEAATVTEGSRAYDATAEWVAPLELDGVIDGDDVSGWAEFQLPGINVGEYTEATLWEEPELTGADAGNYTLAPQDVTFVKATITKAAADKWSVNVAAQEVLMGSGLNAVVVPATGTGIGSEVVQITAMALYSDAELQKPATDADISGLGKDESITLYYKATADNYEAATGPMTVKAIAHQHEWTYAADEATDTITAKCSGTIGNCPSAEQSITLNAPDAVYSGNPVEAEVTPDGADLTYNLRYTGTNYDSADAPANVGDYTVTMTVGDKSVSDTFTISPKDISVVQSIQFSLAQTSFVYSGEAPALNVTGVDSSVGNYTMQENTDYTVGTVQVNAGSHKLTITGKGNYTGTVEVDYTITRAPIGAAEITAEAQVYTGEALMPAFTVTLNGKTLGYSDYVFEWTNNVNVGKGKIVINGVANYVGQAEGTFDITSAPANLTAETYLGESQKGDFTYGDVITIKGAVTVDRQNTFSLRRAPAANEVALYLEGGNDVIAGPVAADPATGEFTMTYDTTNKDIQIGQRNLALKYVSDGNKKNTEGSLTVTLNPKELTIASAEATDRVYAKDNMLVAVTSVTLEGILSGDDVAAVTGVQGTLASDNAGDYTTMALPKLELTGSNKDYYIIAADEAVPTDVTITKAQLVSVELPTDVTLDTYLATADQAAAKLPATVVYTATNGDTVELDAAWTCADFDATPKAVNTFTWTVDASTLTNYELSSAVAATGTIKVTNTDALPVVITATDDSITFAQQPYGVAGMFAVDANAGDAHYEVVSGDAVLNGATLTVNKVGEIVIRLTTEANGAYASAEATATLTVTKADPDVTAPAGLTATYGQTLASVELPAHDEGTWAWVDEAASVGDAGVQTHEITFTPNDTTNWNTLTLDVQVTVSKYNTQVEMMVLNGETETSIFTYGETVTVKAQPQRPAVLTLRRFAAPKANQMALFLGDKQISEAVDPDENGIYTMTIPTADKALKPGDNAVTIKYVGTDNVEDAQGVVTVTLLKKKLSIVSMAAKSREYQPENQQVAVTAAELEGKIEGDDVAVGTLTAQVSSANVGSYAAATLPQTVPLTGEDADYYEAEGDVEVPVPQKVNITQATPEPTGTGADAGQPAVTPVTEDGKTLADIPLSLPEGAYNVPGTIHWVDGDDTPVEEGKEYAWVFIPDDPNYAPVNGTVVIYPAGEAPVITAPTAPQTVTVVEGETGTMTVTATEAEKYQWYIDRNDGKGYVAVDGATAATYTTSKVNTDNDGFTYYCQVSNAYGESKSPVFTLKVKAKVDVPQTGDEVQLGLWLALMVLSLGGMAAMVMNCKRREN